MHVRLVREFHFEAAHRLTSVSPDHRCGRLHGHSYKVELALEGVVDERAGWLIDFAELDQAWKRAADKLDHGILNDVEGLPNPTCEHLTRWIWQAVVGSLPGLKRVTVWETPDARCEYEGKD